MTRNRLAMGLTNTAYTENGAVSNKSTMNSVLDYFYHAPARRGQDNTALFKNAYLENWQDAVLTAFYIRDVRGGAGERNTFRQALQWLADNKPDVFARVLPLIPNYGRWDDVIHFVQHGNVGRACIDLIAAQLELDIDSNRPSLLAKWMPSENTSSRATVARARYLCGMLGMTLRAYRRMLSDLRNRINVVERLMSAKRFEDIDYKALPSKAALKYRKAFHKQDGDRYRAYLEALQKGETKINAATLYPYELVRAVLNNGFGEDQTVEAQWRALPDYTEGMTFLTICDTSGSMTSAMAPNGKTRAIDVAISLAMYSAERARGAFQNMWINFNDVARAYQINPKKSFAQNVHDIYRNNDWGSTNLQSALELILTTATRHNVPVEDMPQALVIVSDMQFNQAGNVTNLEAIRRKFARSPYTMPKIVFWNVASRKDEAPALDTETGVVLVSGASPSIFKAVLSGKSVTPIDLVYEVIHGDRYAPILEMLKD